MCLLLTQPHAVLSLVNTAGPHADNKVHVFDDIPQVGLLKVKILSSKKPQKVILEPVDKAIIYGYTDGKIEFTLPHLKIHDVIVVE